jgi:WD40 repeat protein
LGTIQERLSLNSLGPLSKNTTAAAFSDDGLQLATAHVDGTIRIWNIEHEHRTDDYPNRLIRGAIDEKAYTRVVSFGPGARHILASGLEGDAEIWDVATASRLHRLTGHTKSVSVAEFINPSRILTASDDGTARLWNIAPGLPYRIAIRDRGLLGNSNHTSHQSFSMSKDRRRALFCGYGSNFTAIDTITGSAIWQRPAPENRINACALSPDGTRAVIWTVEEVRLFEIEKNREVTSADWNSKRYQNVIGFSHDGSRIAMSSGGGIRNSSIDIWDARTAVKLDSFGYHDTAMISLQFNSAGDTLLSHASDGTLRIWDTRRSQETADVSFLEANTAPAAISSDQATTVVFAGLDLHPIAKEASTGATKFRLSAASPFHYPEISSNGAVLLTTDESVRGQDGFYAFSVRDGASGRVLARIPSARSAHISSDGKNLAVARSGRLEIRDAITGVVRLEMDIGTREIWIMAFAFDGQLLATVNESEIEIWSLLNMKEPRIVISEAARPGWLKFSRDSQTLFSASGAEIASYDVATGVRKRIYRAFDCKPPTRSDVDPECSNLASLDISPDDEWLLAAMRQDNVCRVWNVRSGRQVAILENHNGAAVFSDDSRHIVTLGRGGIVQRHQLFASFDGLVAHAHAIAPRPLTPAERQELYLDFDRAQTP